MEVFLYNSTVCRLCGEENDNGTLLYTNEEYNQELSETINTYLPLKVLDDGQLPRTICPGCTIQVEATVEFFNLIIKGQKILRELHEREVEYRKCIAKKSPDPQAIAEKIVYEINTSDGVYHVEHPISLQMAGLDKPKRKRGRPSKKLKTPDELAQEAAAAVAAKEEEARQQAQWVQEESHRKRRRKTPPRLKGAVQGKELEKIFLEEGVIDKAESDPIAASPQREGEDQEPEVKTIGHVATSGEPVVVNVRKGRGRPKGVRGGGRTSQCARCGLSFSSVNRYMSHVATHNHDPPFAPKNNTKATKEDPEHNEQPDIADDERGPCAAPADRDQEESEEEPSGVDRRQFKCSQCEKKFSSKQSKSMHIKAVHRGERPYQCLECGLAFAYPRSLSLHTLAHRRRRGAALGGYACDVCDKVLSHPSSVMYHKQAVHGATQYVCGECGKRFRHRQLLQRHQLVHSKRRPFHCEICSTAFKTKANLRNHLQLHAGVKRFSCNICQQRFAHQTSLKLHMRWHAGFKPFSCQTCGKRFGQKGNLSEHERIHTGEKPFACGLCPRRFTTSSQHRLHTLRHGAEASKRAAPPDAAEQTSEQGADGDVIYVTYESPDASTFHILPPQEVAVVEQAELPDRRQTGDRSPLRLRMHDGSVLAVTSLDGETLQILTQDGQAIPVEYDERASDPRDVAMGEEEEAPPARFYTIA